MADGSLTKSRAEVQAIDTAFRPEGITVTAGTKVTWTQVGDQPHSVSANDDTFDSAPDCGPLDVERCDQEGDTFSFTFEEPGEYPYYCRVHGLPSGRGMTGTVTVEA
jgi:plastocyanin